MFSFQDHPKHCYHHMMRKFGLVSGLVIRIKACVNILYIVYYTPLNFVYSMFAQVYLPNLYFISILYPSAKVFSGCINIVKSVPRPTQDPDNQPKYRNNVPAPEITCRWQPFGHSK